jgi:hypothetical protein
VAGSTSGIISGTVRDTNGNPLADVAIIDFQSGPPKQRRQVGLTGPDGSFQIDPFMVYGVRAARFERMGYEAFEIYNIPERSTDSSVGLTVKLQQALQLSPGSTISGVIGPDDITYSDDTGPFLEGYYSCGPCKLINVSAGENGVTLHLSWSGPVPLRVMTGMRDTCCGPSFGASARPGESDIVASTPPMNVALVGVDWNRVRFEPITEAIAFTLAAR